MTRVTKTKVRSIHKKENKFEYLNSIMNENEKQCKCKSVDNFLSKLEYQRRKKSVLKIVAGAEVQVKAGANG